MGAAEYPGNANTRAVGTSCGPTRRRATRTERHHRLKGELAHGTQRGESMDR